ncbi:hypothetical protein F383_18478 [Gossypium arboreum]|uniref:Uncharacterized protein n=1 Tax=Gossypium arboreum TaxID=29729 RepID=A0A0B0NLL8_GOSAR|nr:hypothetical protein F383_18478 [Gossypium arboreum]
MAVRPKLESYTGSDTGWDMAM